MPWLNICACIDWICVNILTEYVCIPWLNMWTWLNWICLHDLTEYQCMTSLSLFGCVHDLIETVCMSAWLNWICVHGFTESVCMTQFNLCIWLNLICAWLNLICVHALTEYVCILTWLNMCTWLDWICVYDLIESVWMAWVNRHLWVYLNRHCPNIMSKEKEEHQECGVDGHVVHNLYHGCCAILQLQCWDLQCLTVNHRL